MEDSVLQFGKHQGKKFSEVPRSYLEWLSQQEIRRQPGIAQQAQEWLDSHPATTQAGSAKEPGLAPATYREASKLAWMAEKGYGNARETLLAARDEDGFLMVVVDEEDDEEHEMLLQVLDNGSIHDARFVSVAQAERVLTRYPALQKDGRYLEDAQETEEREADLKKRTLAFNSQDGRNSIKLVIWAADNIDVFINGVEICPYAFRTITAAEARTWKGAVSMLIPEEPQARKIGLTSERKAEIERVLREI